MPRIDIASAPELHGTSYPEPFRSRVGAIRRRLLGEAAGLDKVGVNLTTLAPGMISSIRHWHEQEDELIFVVSGEVVLIDDDGETPLSAGEAAGFKAGVPDGHQFVNRSDAPAVLLEIGSRGPTERVHYPDDDLVFDEDASGKRFSHKDGSPFV